MCKILFKLLFLYVAAACADERIFVELPIVDSTLKVFNGDGKLLNAPVVRKLEFRQVKLFLKKDPASSTGYFIPQSRCEAVAELQAMLPEDFYSRMLKNYMYVSEYRVNGFGNDRAVVERLVDLEEFLIKIWDLKHPNDIFYMQTRTLFDFYYSLLDFKLRYGSQCQYVKG